MAPGTAYYNDHDPTACAWLRELMKAGLIPEGRVDERPIEEVKAEDVRGYTACHFFAGIGGWAEAHRLASFPADRPVWTASLPCQPFSSAGKKKGQADERHLWPVFFRLLCECRPATCFGEQVASDDGYRWLARVRDEMETKGYAVGCADLPACSQGAPHIRQRLFWGAKRLPDKRRRVRFQFDQRSTVPLEPDECHIVPLLGGRTIYVPKLGLPPDSQSGAGRLPVQPGRPQQASTEPVWRGETGLPSDARVQRRDRRESEQGGGREAAQRSEEGGNVGDGCEPGVMGNSLGTGPQGRGTGVRGEPGDSAGREPPAPAGGSLRNFWSAFDVLYFRDEKYRRVEPGTFPLAHGVPGRVGLLRGYGNAIVPEVAAAFVRAFLDVEGMVAP